MIKRHHVAVTLLVYLLLLGSFSTLQLSSLLKDIIILFLFVPPLLAPALCKKRIYLVMLGVLLLFALLIPLLPTTAGYTPHYIQLFIGIIIAASIGEILYRQTRSRRYAEESVRNNEKQLKQALEDGQNARAALQNANAELEQRVKELSTLNHIMQILANADDLQTALAHITPQIGNLFQASGGGIALLEGDKTNITLASVYSRDLDVSKAIGLSISLAEVAAAKQLVANRKSLIIPRPIIHPATASFFETMKWGKMETLVLSPLLAKTGIIGVIGVGSDSPGRQFTAAEVELLETIAGQIAGAIENARLLEEEQRQRKNAELALHEAQTLYRIGSILAKRKDMQTGIEQALGEYLRALNLRQGGIALFDAAKKSGELYALYRDGQPRLRETPVKLVSRVYRKLIEDQQPIAIIDALNDPLLADNQDLTIAFQIKSILFVPLLARGEVIGALGADSTDAPRQFTKREIQLGQAVADQIATALENARLYENARQDAATMSQLLREVNHRVGNNLTAIVGLLSLEQRHLEKADKSAYKEMMQDLNSRVTGLATVHRMLSSSKWEPLLLSDLTERIIRAALQMLPYNKRIAVSVSPSPVRVTSEQAHNLALIINELTTNCIKYALPNRNRTAITVTITRKDDEICLEFRDDGPGFPEETLHLEHYNVGYDLIKNITEMSLKGSYTLKNDSGAVAIIHFKKAVKNEE